MKDGIIHIGDKTYKKCKVVMLPCNEKTSLIYSNSLLNKLSYGELSPANCLHYNLYIISDEKIKESDYYLNFDTDGNICHFRDKYVQEANYDLTNEFSLKPYSDFCKKIVATTDSSLGLPRPSDDFLKKYCEVNGKISDILIEYFPIYKDGDYNQIDCEYKGIIKDYLLKVAKDNTITIKAVKDSWNREEHIADIKRLIGLYTTTYKDGDINKWIEQNL